jgi:long-chain acyl-CoA synthetase
MDVMTQRADIDAAVSGKTVCTIFADAAKQWGDLPALRWKRDGEWHTLDWKDYRSEVAAVTMALRGLGFGPGQFGLIMARNVPEHVIADLGIVHAGGTAISVYNTLAAEQIEYVANHSEASVAIVEDEAFLAKFLEIRPSTRLHASSGAKPLMACCPGTRWWPRGAPRTSATRLPSRRPRGRLAPRTL